MLTPTAVEAATPVPVRRPSPQMQAARSNLGAVAQDSPQQQPCRRHPTRTLLPRKVGRVPRLRRRLSTTWLQVQSSLCSAARGRVWCTRALKASRNTAMYLVQSTTRRPPTNSDAPSAHSTTHVVNPPTSVEGSSTSARDLPWSPGLPPRRWRCYVIATPPDGCGRSNSHGTACRGVAP